MNTKARWMDLHGAPELATRLSEVGLLSYFTALLFGQLGEQRTHWIGLASRVTWRLIAFMFTALGINKQLDLQTAFTEIGRIVAFSQGWYDERQIVQIYFIIGVAVACSVISLALLVLIRHSPLPTYFALLGTSIVLAFVLIRAASFHHIDRLIGERILGLKWNWVLEMSGISIVIIASEWRQGYDRKRGGG